LNTRESEGAVTARKVAETVWRQRLACLAVALVVFLLGTILVLTRPTVYQSQSSVALLPAATNQATLPNYPNLLTSLLPTYVQLVSSPVLLNQVAGKLPFTISSTQLANDVHAESLSNAAVINIVAQSGNAVQAKEIASKATAVFLAQLKGNGVVIPRIYAMPRVSATPVAPRTSLLMAVVLLLAMLLGLAAGLVWDRFGTLALTLRTLKPRRLTPPEVTLRGPDPVQAPRQSANAGRPGLPEDEHAVGTVEGSVSTVRVVEATTRPATPPLETKPGPTSGNGER